ATVGDDGSWSAQLSAAQLAEGANAEGAVTLTLAQAFGERASEAVSVVVQVADAETPGDSDEPGDSDGPGDADPTAPTPSDDAEADGDLPETGMTPGLLALIVAAAVLLAGFGLTRLRRVDS
ncbi:LPXTG cell wall anchor domain-containing protein, partial [Agrococcus casei]|uniref:LPXTG cell wall anchor domain-containing protein n=1 Tax=Agrococcus casei TaxID=343512 RepID=UPI003F8F8305